MQHSWLCNIRGSATLVLRTFFPSLTLSYFFLPLKKKHALKTYRRKLENEHLLGRGQIVIQQCKRIFFQQQVNGGLCTGVLPGRIVSNSSAIVGVRARLQRTRERCIHWRNFCIHVGFVRREGKFGWTQRAQTIPQRNFRIVETQSRSVVSQ